MPENASQTNTVFNPGRRNFLVTLSKVAAGTALLNIPFLSKAAYFSSKRASITVGEIMDLFIKQVPGAPLPNTVDTQKAGSRDTVVNGVVTTMFATIDVINKAIDAKANFIIAHEPTFYNHADETDWLKEDQVYQYKKDLLAKNNIAVWRNHDYVHSLAMDGVREGVLTQLDWKRFDTGKGENLEFAHPVSLQALIQYLKEKLNISMVRYIGNESQMCQKVLLMPGASGGRSQISAIRKNNPDVLVCGEIQEWETAEYVRDARAAGEQLSLIVLGHIASEEPGSEWMANWLKKNVPGLPVTHIPAGNSLLFA
jgi:putative NIF3 family GTP cyclohydrolase 1 type 2